MKRCKCRFNRSVCNNKQRWNDDKCRFESKELIDKGVCDKGFIWNPINCDCECYKSCNFSECLDYKNYKYKNCFVDKLVEHSSAEECIETRLVKINLTECNSIENKNKHNSCKLHIVLFSIIFTVKIGISSYFLCLYWYLKKNVISVKFGTCTQTTIQ